MSTGQGSENAENAFRNGNKFGFDARLSRSDDVSCAFMASAAPLVPPAAVVATRFLCVAPEGHVCLFNAPNSLRHAIMAQEGAAFTRQAM